MNPSDAMPLSQRVFKSAAWASFSRVSVHIVQLAGQLVLARIIAPREFGLVASVAVFVHFAGLLTDLGLAAAVVQAKEPNRTYLSTAFWLNVGSGAALAIALFLLAPLVAAFYNEPQLTALTRILSITFLVTVGVVPLGILERDLRFRQVAVVEILGVLAGVSSSVLLAVSRAAPGATALVVGPIVNGLVTSFGFLFVTRFRPLIVFDRTAAGSIWGFAGGLTGFNLVNYWSRNADNLLIGRFVGFTQLGYYSRAYMLMYVPFTQVTASLGRALFPGLVRLADRQDRFEAAYLKSLRLIVAAAVPVAAGIAVTAEGFVLLTLGPDWLPAVPLLTVLAIASLPQCVSTSVGWIYQARGRTDILFKWGVFSSLFTIGAFVSGLPGGAVGVASAYAIKSALEMPLAVRVASLAGGPSLRAVLRTVAAPYAAAVVMTSAVVATDRLLVETYPPEFGFVTQVGVGVVVYVTALRLIAPDIIKTITALVRGPVS